MSKRIMIDPGHAPGNANGGKNGYKEYAGMWKLSAYLKTALERCGLQAGITRAENENPALYARGEKAAGCDLFISQHSNAANGAARGVEVYYSIKLPGDKAYAAAVSKAVSTLMGNPDRGAKTREGALGEDYYTVIQAAQRSGAAHVLMVESGFHDNIQDEAFLLSDKNLKDIAETQTRVICTFLSWPYIGEGEQSATPIISAPTASMEQMMKWAQLKNASHSFIYLIDIFYKLSLNAGVNPSVTYCQSAKETSYGRFGGVLDESYCNPCGMKTKDGGENNDPNAHKKFDYWYEGIEAQVDHLALYAGVAGYPKANSPDPRHFPYLMGTAKTIEELGGKWAPSAEYGKEIAAMMRELEATVVLEDEKDQQENSRITLIIGSDVIAISAENISGFWYVTIGAVKIKIRDILETLGYNLIWDEVNRVITAVKR